MYDVVEAGDRRQVLAIWLKLLAGKARKKMKVGRWLGCEDGRKHGSDLGQTLVVPHGLLPVQGRRNEHLEKSNENVEHDDQ